MTKYICGSKLANSGKRVILAGLDMDFAGKSIFEAYAPVNGHLPSTLPK